jgi:hypothetical protein
MYVVPGCSIFASSRVKKLGSKKKDSNFCKKTKRSFPREAFFIVIIFIYSMLRPSRLYKAQLFLNISNDTDPIFTILIKFPIFIAVNRCSYEKTQ